MAEQEIRAVPMFPFAQYHYNQGDGLDNAKQ
jgi:hypothetical protein